MEVLNEGHFNMGTVSDVIVEGLRVQFNQRYTKGHYSLINHYSDAKDNWDNVEVDSGMVLRHKYGSRRAELWFKMSVEFNANNQGNPLKNNAQEEMCSWNVGGQNRGGIINPDQPNHLCATNSDECDAFDSDVDEGPTTQTMFMTNLTSKDQIYDEAGPSYDSNTPYEVQDHDTFVNHLDEYHEVHEMQTDEQHNYVVDSDADYTSNSNIIPYDQYVEDNEDHVVQRNVSSVRNDALMSILDEMHEQEFKTKVAIGYKNPLCLTRAKQAQSALYNGHVLITTNHTPTVIHDSEDTREIAEIIGQRMLLKCKPVVCLFKEVKEMEEIFNQMNNEVDKNIVDKQCVEIVKKNLLIENENLIANYLSTQLLLFTNLQEIFDNEKSYTVQEAPDFNSFFKIKNLEHQIQEKDNVIRDLKVLVANVNDRSCEPYNAKDVTASYLEQMLALGIETRKGQTSLQGIV
ncbi:hypothetical protein Tco_1019491 [Tanacetum coccineum]|uniref:Uncharacterized protein n=1 Tax=Tanacetum coccineum TaxID=301880 RepID=A0ABQ5FXA2_9ASTR